MSEIIQFPAPEGLTREQRDYFHGQAAYWEVVQETAQKQLDYATEQRAYSMRMLGMIAIDGGYPE